MRTRSTSCKTKEEGTELCDRIEEESTSPNVFEECESTCYSLVSMDETTIVVKDHDLVRTICHVAMSVISPYKPHNVRRAGADDEKSCVVRSHSRRRAKDATGTTSMEPKTMAFESTQLKI